MNRRIRSDRPESQGKYDVDFPILFRMLLRLGQLLLLGVLAFCVPPLLMTAGSYIYFHSTDRILPGVTLGEYDLSWKTPVEVALFVEQQWNQVDQITLVDLDDPNRIWEDRASAFGLWVDSAAIAQAAYQKGRDGSGVQSVLALMTVLREGASVNYQVSMDATLAKSRLEEWAEIVFAPAQDELIALKGRALIQSEAVDGKALDVLATLDLMIEDPVSVRVEHQMIPLVMASIPANRIDTTEASVTLERILDADLHLTGYDPVTDEMFEWRPSDDDLAQWIDLAVEGDAYQVSFASDDMLTFLQDIDETLGFDRTVDLAEGLAILEAQLSGGGDKGQPLIIEYLPSTYVVQPGDNLVSISFRIGLPYWKLYETNPDLSTKGLVVGETLIVPPKDDMLDLPVLPSKRIVIGILDQRMWVYENHEVMREHIVSTGIPSSPTLPGIFQVNSHYENAYASIWDLYMPHFMGIYDAVPGLTNGIHGLPLLSSGRRLWADVLGNPASYGCIILDLQAAEELFYWAEEGVVVEIRE